MKKTLIPMIGVMVVGATLTACASPDNANKTVLLLDHGPRAQTTPWANQQRLLRSQHQAHVKAEAKDTPEVDHK